MFYNIGLREGSNPLLFLKIEEVEALNERLEYWAKVINVTIPKTYRVRKNQVTNENMRHYRFNGYCEATDTLYYQGKLEETIIVHELLHKKFPHLKEIDIRKLTAIILQVSKN